MWMAAYIGCFFILIIAFFPELFPSFFFPWFTAQVKSPCCVIKIKMLCPSEGPSVTFLSTKRSIENILRIDIIVYIIWPLLSLPSCPRSSMLIRYEKIGIPVLEYHFMIWYSSLSFFRYCKNSHDSMLVCSNQGSHVINVSWNFWAVKHIIHAHW